MNYRTFVKPNFTTRRHDGADWRRWMQSENDLLIPVAPIHDHSCGLCLGPVGYLGEGPRTWPTCQQCRGYEGAVDRVVPITYSIDAGLESMLHRYKDWGVGWLRSPLALLLCLFVQEHGHCIDEATGLIDVATVVPSDNDSRAFNHLDSLLAGGIVGDRVLERFAWDCDLIQRDRTTPRPARGKLKPSAYQVQRPLPRGSAVLLFDDTWTSGASAASAAAVLKDAGAADVTVLTLGRQLKADGGWGTTQVILSDRRGALWAADECVLCSSPG